MSVLNAWQRLDRVISRKPFGDGKTGDISSATIPTLTKDSVSGSATSTTLTTSGSTFANGDIILLYQARGTGVGQWEINQVVSGGGTTSLTLKEALHYTYTDSGASQALAIKIPQYKNCTVESGTWTLPAWDGNFGGIMIIAVRGTFTVTGNVVGTGKGFVGGAGLVQGSDSSSASCGEGTANASQGNTYAANGNGAGGGGKYGGGCSGAGGGGNALSGTTGSSANSPNPGQGGSASGSADLISMTFGGGGGGGRVWGSGSAGSGGTGGGLIIVFANKISVSGSMAVNGNSGGASSSPDHIGRSGGGAGGSILIVTSSGDLGTGLITASAGSQGSGSGGTSTGAGGDGSVGRITVHHSKTVTGTTTPTFTDVSDPTLVEKGGFMSLL